MRNIKTQSKWHCASLSQLINAGRQVTLSEIMPKKLAYRLMAVIENAAYPRASSRPWRRYNEG